MTNNIDRLPITSDYVFKRVFSYKGNEDVLKGFLEAILDIKIEKIEIKNPELTKNTKEDKLSVLDIKAEIDDNSIIDIEMQMENEKNIEERSTTYLGKLVAEQLQAGDIYNQLKKTVVICILNFNYFERNSYHSIAKMKFEDTSKESYVDMGHKKEDKIASRYIEMHYIELQKFKKKNPDIKARINQWLWLLAGGEEKLEMIEKENKEVKKAVETLNRISLDPVERERYESIVQAEFNKRVSNRKFLEEGRKEIIEKLLEENIDINELEKLTGLEKEKIQKAVDTLTKTSLNTEEGKAKKEEKLQIAKKLLTKGLSVKEIMEITELNEKEIQDLIK